MDTISAPTDTISGICELQHHASEKSAWRNGRAEPLTLKLTIAKLRRMQFGRKSEKVERQIEQLELRLEDLQADEGAATQADSKKAQQRRESAGRKPLPDHLEREERVHRPLEVGFEEITSDRWRDEVYRPDIEARTHALYKKPGYAM